MIGQEQGSDIELDHCLILLKVINDLAHIGSLQITNEPNLPLWRVESAYYSSIGRRSGCSEKASPKA